MGDVGGELDDLETPVDLAQGVRQGLAVFGGEQLGQILLMAVDQFPEGEHDLLAPGQGGVPPAGKGYPGSSDGQVDFLDGGERHFGCHLPGGRVVDPAGPLGRSGYRFVVDPMFNRFHCCTPR